jgi:hypothetical protein
MIDDAYRIIEEIEQNEGRELNFFKDNLWLMKGYLDDLLDGKGRTNKLVGFVEGGVMSGKSYLRRLDNEGRANDELYGKLLDFYNKIGEKIGMK